MIFIQMQLFTVDNNNSFYFTYILFSMELKVITTKDLIKLIETIILFYLCNPNDNNRH